MLQIQNKVAITYVRSFLHAIWNLCRDWLSGGVPASLAVWLVLLTSIDPMKIPTYPGGIITFTGLSVYLEFGLQIPRSGGEKNYLERVYRKPKYLATSVFLSQMILLGFSSGNALAFGRYVLLAAGSTAPDGWAARGIAVGCISFAVLLHGILPKWGTRLFDVLGIFKVVILLFIVFSGFAALAGHRKVPNPHNFDNAVRL